MKCDSGTHGALREVAAYPLQGGPRPDWMKPKKRLQALLIPNPCHFITSLGERNLRIIPPRARIQQRARRRQHGALWQHEPGWGARGRGAAQFLHGSPRTELSPRGQAHGAGHSSQACSQSSLFLLKGWECRKVRFATKTSHFTQNGGGERTTERRAGTPQPHGCRVSGGLAGFFSSD